MYFVSPSLKTSLRAWGSTGNNEPNKCLKMSWKWLRLCLKPINPAMLCNKPPQTSALGRKRLSSSCEVGCRRFSYNLDMIISYWSFFLQNRFRTQCSVRQKATCRVWIGNEQTPSVCSHFNWLVSVVATTCKWPTETLCLTTCKGFPWNNGIEQVIR